VRPAHLDQRPWAAAGRALCARHRGRRLYNLRRRCSDFSAAPQKLTIRRQRPPNIGWPIPISTPARFRLIRSYSAVLLAPVSSCNPRFVCRSAQGGHAIRHETRPMAVRKRWLTIDESGTAHRRNDFAPRSKRSASCFAASTAAANRCLMSSRTPWGHSVGGRKALKPNMQTIAQRSVSFCFPTEAE